MGGARANGTAVAAAAAARALRTCAGQKCHVSSVPRRLPVLPPHLSLQRAYLLRGRLEHAAHAPHRALPSEAASDELSVGQRRPLRIHRRALDNCLPAPPPVRCC